MIGADDWHDLNTFWWFVVTCTVRQCIVVRVVHFGQALQAGVQAGNRWSFMVLNF